MPLPSQWATPEDFATLFQYFWHRDFPVDEEAIAAKRTDWTIHIGVVVRNMAALMGLKARFESGGRTDAVLRSWDGDEIAIEWEWQGLSDEELDNLKDRRVWARDKVSDRKLRYAVLITYTLTSEIRNVYSHVKQKWEGARWPLLLILIDFEETKKFHTHREFKNMQISLFDSNAQNILRVVRAYPWEIESARGLG